MPPPRVLERTNTLKATVEDINYSKEKSRSKVERKLDDVHRQR
jgi:hypothetical protein